MKRNLPRVSPLARPCRIGRGAAAVTVLVLTGLLASIVYLVRAQNTGVADSVATSRDLAWQAITNPVATAAAAEAQLTPEQLADKAFHLWAFENPGEYYQKFIKNDPARAVAAEAQWAILNPVEATARFLQQRTPERKAQDDRASYGIEHPVAGQP
jgi:hypothetical protein